MSLQVLLFDNRMWHKGGTNVSDSARIGLIMVYFPWWLSQDQNRPVGTVQRELLKAETGLTDEVRVLFTFWPPS